MTGDEGEHPAMAVEAAARLLAARVPEPVVTVCPVCGTPLSWWPHEAVRMHSRYHRAQAVVAQAVATPPDRTT